MCSTSFRTPPRSTAARSVGGVAAADLVRAHGSPLVVYDEATLRASARAYREAAPDAFVCYGTKAFPNVALLRLLAEEGIGADVSTLGELRFAQRGRHRRRPPRRPRQQQVRRGARAPRPRQARSSSSTRSRRSTAPATAGVTRTLIRVTPGIEADTHEHIRTGHHGSKFGLPPDDALEATPPRAGDARACTRTSARSSLDIGAALMAVDWLATFAARARAETGWEPRTIDLGGGLGVAIVAGRAAASASHEFVRGLLGELERACALHGLARPQVILEPGRSLVARAGVTLYTRRLGQARVGRDDLRRGRRRHLRQPAARALRRPLHGAAREPRRRGADGHVRRRRQALRVGRPADRARRAAGAAPRRHPRGPGDRRATRSR